MTNRSETLAQDLKAWAADQLHVEPECAPAQARAAFLRQVQLDNGVPNLAAREAMLILTGRNLAARPALALEAAEEKLQRDVDDFAARFFSLPIAERKAEWARLRARGHGFVRVDARLAALRAGLEIALPAFERATPAQQLVSIVGELFVLRPVERASRRQAFLADAKRSGDWMALAQAAALLQSNHAAAGLEPALIAGLTESAARVEEKKQLNRSMQKAAEPVAAGGSSSKWPWALVAVVAFALIRVFAMDRSPPKQNPVIPPAPNFNMPKFDPNDALKNFKFRRGKDGILELEDPGAPERVFGKDTARRPLDPPKDKPPEVPNDKRDFP